MAFLHNGRAGGGDEGSMDVAEGAGGGAGGGAEGGAEGQGEADIDAEITFLYKVGEGRTLRLTLFPLHLTPNSAPFLPPPISAHAVLAGEGGACKGLLWAQCGTPRGLGFEPVEGRSGARGMDAARGEGRRPQRGAQRAAGGGRRGAGAEAAAR